MDTVIFLENSTPLSLAESWERTCNVINDAPLSAAYWHLETMTGEMFLNELPPLQLTPGQLTRRQN